MSVALYFKHCKSEAVLQLRVVPPELGILNSTTFLGFQCGAHSMSLKAKAETFLQKLFCGQSWVVMIRTPFLSYLIAKLPLQPFLCCRRLHSSRFFFERIALFLWFFFFPLPNCCFYFPSTHSNESNTWAASLSYQSMGRGVHCRNGNLYPWFSHVLGQGNAHTTCWNSNQCCSL